MTELLHTLAPFLVGLGSIAVVIGLLVLCAWFLSNDDDLND
jgi:hypothetical protein